MRRGYGNCRNWFRQPRVTSLRCEIAILPGCVHPVPVARLVRDRVGEGTGLRWGYQKPREAIGHVTDREAMERKRSGAIELTEASCGGDAWARAAEVQPRNTGGCRPAGAG